MTVTASRPALAERVRALYAAFGRGDVAAVLAELAADVDWSANVDPSAPGASAVPVCVPRRGPAEVAAFFGDMTATFEMHAFEPRRFFESGDEVAVRLWFDFTVRRTGRRLAGEALHHWAFDASGRVRRFRDFYDTLAAATACAALPAD